MSTSWYYADDKWHIWMALGKEINIWRPLHNDIGMWFFINEEKIYGESKKPWRSYQSMFGKSKEEK